MERIWAPWRMKYIQSKKSKACLFCKIAKAKEMDKKNYILNRSKFCFSMLNIYPYNNGHMMICPYRHIREITKLSKEEILDLMQMLSRCKIILDKALRPQGYNIGLNIGQVAGAGFEGHLHIHIIPRWGGDTNFMPTVSNTKIISQSLQELYRKLKCEDERRNPGL